MRKLKNLCRLLSTVLAISLIILGTNLTVFATEDVATEESTEEISDIQSESTVDATENEIVHISEDGNISYETISATTEETSTYSNEDIVILNDTPSTLQEDDVMATASSNDLQDVSLFSVPLEPYKHMCLITTTFPNGNVMESSGILISQNLVLASAHGIYWSEYGGAAKHVDIGVGAYFANSKIKYQGYIYSWNGAILSSNWPTTEKQVYDWSLIKLPENIDYPYQKCGYVPDYTQATNKDIRLIGYPGVEGKGATAFKTSTGQITGTTDNLFINDKVKNLWTLSAKGDGGMSGGPIIEESNGVVIGIYVARRGLVNTALANPLTKEIADVILQNAVW